ncbi:hypothetical protein ASG61_18975 [Bacillus sp. Leaf75]|jgi:hypothetical protein|nr:hypothetical protein ASG61_18975 [Bacillus sp. Leaf75]
MAKKFEFKTLYLNEDGPIRHYTVKCIHENFEKIVNVRETLGNIHIPNLTQQFEGLNSVGRIGLGIQLKDHIEKQ